MNVANKQTLPDGTVLRWRFGTRTVRWVGSICNLLDENGRVVNYRSEGQCFGLFGETKYSVISRPFAPHENICAVRPGDWLASLSNGERKECAVHRGLFAYFPDALAAVARHSKRSNDKHNPGQPLHWSREKSSDHNDCVGRHALAVAANPDALDDGQPEVVCRAWRALADLQLWIEGKHAKGEKV